MCRVTEDVTHAAQRVDLLRRELVLARRRLEAVLILLGRELLAESGPSRGIKGHQRVIKARSKGNPRVIQGYSKGNPRRTRPIKAVKPNHLLAEGGKAQGEHLLRKATRGHAIDARVLEERIGEGRAERRRVPQRRRLLGAVRLCELQRLGSLL